MAGLVVALVHPRWFFTLKGTLMNAQSKTLIATAALAAALGSATAAPVKLTWVTTTATGTSIPGSSVGETLTTIITVDNGGNSLASQAWSASNFVSFRQEGASGWWLESSVITSFTGSFTTDALGNVLTAGRWQGGWQAGALLTSWAGATTGGWWNNGNNETACRSAVFQCVWAANVQANQRGASWTAALGDSTTVPEPASFGLVGLGLALAAVARKRRAA